MELLGGISLADDRESQIPAQSLTWAVEAEPDGRLMGKTSGAKVTYLYWEATYVLCCFCVVRPRMISFFLSLDIWLFQREFPSRHARRLSRNNPRGRRRGI